MCVKTCRLLLNISLLSCMAASNNDSSAAHDRYVRVDPMYILDNNSALNQIVCLTQRACFGIIDHDNIVPIIRLKTQNRRTRNTNDIRHYPYPSVARQWLWRAVGAWRHVILRVRQPANLPDILSIKLPIYLSMTFCVMAAMTGNGSSNAYSPLSSWR